MKKALLDALQGFEELDRDRALDRLEALIAAPRGAPPAEA